MGCFPDWLRKSIPEASTLRTEEIVRSFRLVTVCHSAKCPNRPECFAKSTATFLLLGNVCTRRCSFCAVSQGNPSGEDRTEPERVARASLELGLKHVVLTSVTRDDLQDGGAGIFARTVIEIRKAIPGATVEVLTPDFKGDEESILEVASAGPDVYNHNLETVSRLYPEVRPGASYERSLDLLRTVKGHFKNMLTKSGLMAGLGETAEEIFEVFGDLREAGCDVVTVGQYLKPAEGKFPVKEYVKPEIFQRYEKTGLEMGFKAVFSGAFVRSSYHAKDILECAQAVS